MTGHLARLAVRAVRPPRGGLRPRLSSVFEQPGVLPMSLPTVDDHDGGPAPAPRVASRTGTTGDERPASAPSTPSLSNPSSPTPSSTAARRPVGRASDDAVAPAAFASARRDRPPVTGEASPNPARPQRRRHPAVPDPQDVSGRRRPERVVASLVAEALSDGLPTSAVPRVDRAPGAEPPAPRAGVPAVQAVSPAPATPQLRPPVRPGRRDSAPEVTVNIGRIEVVPAAPESRKPPQRRPRPPARAPGAPGLADYLRERNAR